MSLTSSGPVVKVAPQPVSAPTRQAEVKYPIRLLIYPQISEELGTVSTLLSVCSDVFSDNVPIREDIKTRNSTLADPKVVLSCDVVLRVIWFVRVKLWMETHGS